MPTRKVWSPNMARLQVLTESSLVPMRKLFTLPVGSVVEVPRAQAVLQQVVQVAAEAVAQREAVPQAVLLAPVAQREGQEADLAAPQAALHAAESLPTMCSPTDH